MSLFERVSEQLLAVEVDVGVDLSAVQLTLQQAILAGALHVGNPHHGVDVCGQSVRTLQKINTRPLKKRVFIKKIRAISLTL